MVDCGGRLVLKVWELLNDSQEKINIYNIAEKLNGLGNRARIKIALTYLMKMGLVREIKIGYHKYYIACMELPKSEHFTKIQKETEEEKLLDVAISQEIPKGLLRSDDLKEEEVKMIKCNCCLEEKEEYVSGLCEECANKMDNHLEGENEI
jgi:Fe2+ or Zn2+ uptake regulation protein